MFNSTNKEFKRDEVPHDPVAEKIRELAQATDNYYTVYMKLCHYRNEVQKIQNEMRRVEEECVRAKHAYEQTIKQFNQ